jgi:hypothetical protein
MESTLCGSGTNDLSRSLTPLDSDGALFRGSTRPDYRSAWSWYFCDLLPALRLIAYWINRKSCLDTQNGANDLFAEIETLPKSGNLACAISALFWSTRNRRRIAARIRSSEKVPLGMIWTLLPRNLGT